MLIVLCQHRARPSILECVCQLKGAVRDLGYFWAGVPERDASWYGQSRVPMLKRSRAYSAEYRDALAVTFHGFNC